MLCWLFWTLHITLCVILSDQSTAVQSQHVGGTCASSTPAVFFFFFQFILNYDYHGIKIAVDVITSTLAHSHLTFH